MNIKPEDYFTANLADYSIDLLAIATLAIIGCSATTILCVWAVSCLLGIRSTYRNARKYARGDA